MDSYFLSRDFQTLCRDGANARKQQKIVGPFLYEDTTTYLFSRTNYGKSLLVFQFAYASATGTSFDTSSCFINQCAPKKTLVVDLELDAREIYKRHGMALDSMSELGSQNLIYLHEKADNKIVLGFDLLAKIEDAAIRHQAQVVIVDNMSRLLPDSLKPELVTLLISSLNKIRQKTGASIVVIGHTTKGNPKVAIQPTDYFGSSMVQNFFSEISFIDTTPDGKFFFSHAKTKHEESFVNEVPVFTRGPHPVVGIGFNFEAIRPLTEVQLPTVLPTLQQSVKKRFIDEFANELMILKQSNVPVPRIAEFSNFNRSSVYRFFNT
jgi:RecA-family ATPase